MKAKYVYYDKKRPALKGNMTRKDYKLIAQEFRRIQYKYVELSAQTKNIIDDLRVGLAIEGCGSFKTTPPRLFNQSEMGSFVLASRVWSLPGHFPVGIVRRVVALLFLLQMETPVRLKIAADPQRPQA